MLQCTICKSKNVEQKAWIDANTNKVMDLAEEGTKENPEDNWCRDCEQHVFLEVVEEPEMQTLK